MQIIKISEVKKEVQRMLVKASFDLPQDIIDAIKRFSREETSLTAKEILNDILENEKIARQQKLPLCQDCGSVYINLSIGSNIYIEGSGDLNSSLNQAVAEVYKEYYLRKSIVSDPLFDRRNTLDNTPAIIEVCFTSDNFVHIEISLKGGGSENCSYLFMLNPSASEKEIIKVVEDAVRGNVTKCCPPAIVGVGIGSVASEVTKLARKAAFRNLNIRNSDPRYSVMEEKILERVNSSGIGPQGLGGKTTALACNIEYAPCHMATLPLAVFLGCHSTRRADSYIFPT